MSRIFYRDGRVLEWPPEIAYLIWLAGPGTAIRVSGDNRPVMPWEYCTGGGENERSLVHDDEASGPPPY